MCRGRMKLKEEVMVCLMESSIPDKFFMNTGQGGENGTNINLLIILGNTLEKRLLYILLG